MKLLVLFFCVFLLAGCGKKGALIPPEALVPAAVANLQLAQRGEAFRISWSAPTREVSGRPLKEGLRFRLFRRAVLPPGQDCAACPDTWKVVREIDPASPGAVEQGSGLYTYVDHDLLPDATYQYRILAVDPSGGISRPALLPPRQRQTPPFPPVLQAATGGTGVHLEFVAPTAATRETKIGYLLFRQEGTYPQLQLTTSPISSVTFEDADVRQGLTYHYTARTVATINGQIIESADSNEAVITVTLPE